MPRRSHQGKDNVALRRLKRLNLTLAACRYSTSCRGIQHQWKQHELDFPREFCIPNGGGG